MCSLTRAGAKQASRDIELPYSQLGTVHSFASRALGSPIVAESKVSEWNEAYPAFALSAHSATPDDAYGSREDSTYADQAKLDVAWYRTMGIPMVHWIKVTAMDFAKKWEDWKQQCGYLDFTDLIEYAYRDCEKAPGDPAVILCDEAQDTGGLEMQLLMKWGESAQHVVFAGDSAQAIFSWRGSDPLLLQRLWQFHDRDRVPLQQSFRLSKAVYAYAYKWARERFTQTMALSFIPRDVEGSVQNLSESFSRFAPTALEKLVEDYTHNDDTLMFQATCGYMLDPIIRTLRQLGVPFYNPSRPNSGKWNPLPQKRNKGLTVIDRVLAFMRPDVATWGEQARFWTGHDLKAWVAGLPATGVLLRGKAKEIDALADDTTDEEIAIRMPGWFTSEALAQIVPKPQFDWYMGKMSEGNKGSASLRDYVMEIIQRRGGVAVLRERPQVIVGTVHSLKGAEATTVVMCPDISMQAYAAMQESEEVTEEMRRVFYVGLTRAKDCLLLCQPGPNISVRW